MEISHRNPHFPPLQLMHLERIGEAWQTQGCQRHNAKENQCPGAPQESAMALFETNTTRKWEIMEYPPQTIIIICIYIHHIQHQLPQYIMDVANLCIVALHDASGAWPNSIGSLPHSSSDAPSSIDMASHYGC